MIWFDTILSTLFRLDTNVSFLVKHNVLCFNLVVLDNVVIPWTSIVKARSQKQTMQTLISFIVLEILIRLLWPRDHTQLGMDFLLCLGRFFLSWTFSSIAQYGGADGQLPQKVECGSIWKQQHLSSFQSISNWTCSIFLIGAILILSQPIFWKKLWPTHYVSMNTVPIISKKF